LEAQRTLRRQFPNLEVILDEHNNETDLLKTSVGNLVRLCRPPVIVDEGHKATSAQAQSTIEGFNASVVVELSATPLPHPAPAVPGTAARRLRRLERELRLLPSPVCGRDRQAGEDGAGEEGYEGNLSGVVLDAANRQP
jgi:hypothetical protein